MKLNRYVFGPGSQPDLRSVRADIEGEFPELRRRNPRVFRLALNEAEAVAWQTGFAGLVFPVLAEEKARNLSFWQLRQSLIRDDSSAVALAE